jgi:hypothetical protein
MRDYINVKKLTRRKRRKMNLRDIFNHIEVEISRDLSELLMIKQYTELLESK